jgi:YidC/Oxa1 family membrane protein insertase
MIKLNKSIGDIVIIAALFGAMMAWGPVYQKFFAPPPVAVVNEATPESVSNVVPPVAEVEAVKPVVHAEPTSPVAPVLKTAAVERVPEETFVLSNQFVHITLSSRGGAVVSVELTDYQVTQDDPRPVLLDFKRVPALAYEGWTGLDVGGDYVITVISNGAAARLEALAKDGIRVTRQITLGEKYLLTVEDRVENMAGELRVVPSVAMTVGEMQMLAGEKPMSGVDFLGIDTHSSVGGAGVRHWANKGWFSDELTIADYFQESPIRGHGCVGRPSMTKPLPSRIQEPIKGDVDWMAVKNKFFVQILAPKGGAEGCELIAGRVVDSTEDPAQSRTWQNVATPSYVAGALRFSAKTLAPKDSFERSFEYYVGPKELSSISSLGRRMKEVMDFGMWRWVCEGLVWGLKWLYGLIPNYGVAIILLTLIVRIIFWPLTHKGTESMKRMQELQPKVKELQEKYRDKPQKLQQETMALYREHKVNPVGGCLPMLIQIPVFFALFNVLRSAVELRYAGFLWIGDLSEAENLFQGMIPLVGSLNILPLIMAATQAWQQHLTPTAGDPAQQKMMMFMPVIMLLFLYSMPSALVLYWTANQVMMIVQLLWQRRLKKAA